ncbi:MAG: glycerol-3-phosphate responsive antiterminator [Ruminococcaceae bacterium]|nr:glycerol-3-phosphate responsive antiterminator [Oscillospiraceae bacterium]
MDSHIIAAVRGEQEFENALLQNVSIIFDLSPDLLSVANRIKKAHGAGKKLFVHIDLATGIGKDESGLSFLKGVGVDGIISTRTNIIKLAKKLDMFTVQRFFIVDSHSIDTSIEAVKTSKPDMIEIMPGTIAKVIRRLKIELDMPIVAGGLIETEKEIEEVLECGASAVSTGKKELWKMRG